MRDFPLDILKKEIEGDIFTGEPFLLMYATDASAYKEKPDAVIRPKNRNDIEKIIRFAREHKIPIIPRAAGTSLAGQVVGKGMIVDISRHLNKILEINAEERWVRVEPGVVLDELNEVLKPYGLFFAPETSTSNRCMIGGMVGNNACGAHSLIYGSTRDHLLAVKGFLSDGSEVEFRPLSPEEFEKKCLLKNREGEVYRKIRSILSDPENRANILKEYPDPSLKRRNTGYAIDILLRQQPFTPEGGSLNLASLIAGSEGTLMFLTEITLHLEPLPPPVTGLVAVHCHTLEEALQANLMALTYSPGSIELMDKIIIDCTRENIEQRKNRFFIQGEPGAIIIAEFARNSLAEIEEIRNKMEKEMGAAGLGYYFPLITGPDIKRVWALRKAGLGLLSNIPGDAKPVAVIEDTAVAPDKLPGYIAEFKEMLQRLGLNCVYYAHIATGELHLRPVLNLKDPDHVRLFRTVATETAKLVKKYNGSLSGEHGDGRLRGEFIPMMVGEKNYALLKEIKRTFDPEGILNPGKITDTPPMDTSLRYEPGVYPTEPETILDFSSTMGYIRMAENCNGSADCRKSARIGGTMCPSYMATMDENTTTRARANILREFISHPNQKNPFDHKEIYDILDLCLSCKGCKSECPSNVDMAKLKAEFLQHYYDSHGVPLRARLVAYITWFNKLGSVFPALYNQIITSKLITHTFMKWVGFTVHRTFPKLYKTTLRRWARKNLPELNASLPENASVVNLFVDEFTNYNDVEIGIKAIKLLTRLGYRVQLPRHGESARTYISKGLLRRARKIARTNLLCLKDYVSEERPLLGIEPSAILGFRDEYPDLMRGEMKELAKKIASCSYMIDEFLAREMDRGNIKKEQFTTRARTIKLHGHCQQKAVASTNPTKKVLSFPENYTVTEIPSGCCGMAGSFGYEKEHYELSMKVGELVLFPAIRNAPEDVIIAAPGTSCRHQIEDGTGRKGLHPVEILYDALV